MSERPGRQMMRFAPSRQHVAHGRPPLDTNAVENAIRPILMTRFIAQLLEKCLQALGVGWFSDSARRAGPLQAVAAFTRASARSAARAKSQNGDDLGGA